MAFGRDRNSGSGRGGFRPRFESRGPVEMHKAICDNCGKECEVPFRPTGGKPIYCSSCFENKGGGSEGRGADSRGAGRRDYEEKQMFDAVCADCGNSCKVPFRPSGDKPVFCSNCFGEKKGAGDKYQEQFDNLNNKLDKILLLLNPSSATTVSEPVLSEVEVVEPVKKKPSKKK